MSTTVSSVIGAGAHEAAAGSGEYLSRNPARLDDVVARVELGGADALHAAAKEARTAQREWAQVPAPVRGLSLIHISEPTRPY